MYAINVQRFSLKCLKNRHQVKLRTVLYKPKSEKEEKLKI